MKTLLSSLFLILATVHICRAQVNVLFNPGNLVRGPLTNREIIMLPASAPFNAGAMLGVADSYDFYTGNNGDAVTLSNVVPWTYNVTIPAPPFGNLGGDTIFTIVVPTNAGTWNVVLLITNAPPAPGPDYLTASQIFDLYSAAMPVYAGTNISIASAGGSNVISADLTHTSAATNAQFSGIATNLVTGANLTNITLYYPAEDGHGMIIYQNSIFYSSDTQQSINVENRQLWRGTFPDNAPVVDWDNGLLNDASGDLVFDWFNCTFDKSAIFNESLTAQSYLWPGGNTLAANGKIYYYDGPKFLDANDEGYYSTGDLMFDVADNLYGYGTFLKNLQSSNLVGTVLAATNAQFSGVATNLVASANVTNLNLYGQFDLSDNGSKRHSLHLAASSADAGLYIGRPTTSTGEDIFYDDPDGGFTFFGFSGKGGTIVNSSLAEMFRWTDDGHFYALNGSSIDATTASIATNAPDGNPIASTAITNSLVAKGANGNVTLNIPSDNTDGIYVDGVSSPYNGGASRTPYDFSGDFMDFTDSGNEEGFGTGFLSINSQGTGYFNIEGFSDDGTLQGRLAFGSDGTFSMDALNNTAILVGGTGTSGNGNSFIRVNIDHSSYIGNGNGQYLGINSGGTFNFNGSAATFSYATANTLAVFNSSKNLVSIGSSKIDGSGITNVNSGSLHIQTNAAPSNVTIGTTAPDLWMTNYINGTAYYIPMWKAH